jgi:cytochrome d ubiquinol oxidase subunit II
MSLALVVAAVLLVVLVVYSLTGGADLGGGVWDLFAVGRRAQAQRDAVERAIGPIWEANHVWLIVVVVLLFVCFPTAFAAMSTALHVPLTVMLFGVILRGTAFVFRHYDTPETYRRWSRIFALSSVLVPFTLGLSLGAVASGSMRIVDGRVATDFVSEWAAPFPVSVGLFTVALFATLAAVYLAVEAEEPALADDFRARGVAGAVITAVLAYTSLALARSGAPPVYEALAGRSWSVAFQLAAFGLGSGLVAALWVRRFQLARAAAAALVVWVEAGWAAGHLPYVIPPDLTVDAAAAPDAVLRMTLVVLASGSVLLIPSFVLLYVVFKRPGADSGV